MGNAPITPSQFKRKNEAVAESKRIIYEKQLAQFKQYIQTTLSHQLEESVGTNPPLMIHIANNMQMSVEDSSTFFENVFDGWKLVEIKYYPEPNNCFIAIIDYPDKIDT